MICEPVFIEKRHEYSFTKLNRTSSKENEFKFKQQRQSVLDKVKKHCSGTGFCKDTFIKYIKRIS
jgi:hypothetical protein